jgi:polyvinyl alcohol dehydrogenase (cytochrome)
MDTPGAEAFGPAGAAIAAPPAVDATRGLIYVATQDSYNPNAQPLADAIVALDILDGKVRWAKQLIVPEGAPSAFDAAPVLRAAPSGRLSLLAGQRSGVVYSLDPDRTGEINWQTPLQAGKVPGSVGWGTAADHRSLYVPLTGLGTDPPDTSGSLAAVDIRTGAKRWLTPSPVPACSWTADPAACSHAMAQAVSVIPGAAFAGSRDGHLRAYSTIDGKILWDYDTAKDFVTVNHVKAAGGSLDRGGPTIVNGVVFVNSGSAPPGQSGNVLLAFSVDGK